MPSFLENTPIVAVPRQDVVHPLLYQAQLTPAIEKLHEAFREGLLTPGQIDEVMNVDPKLRQLKIQRAQEEIAASQGRERLLPKQEQLTNVQLDAGIGNVPLQARADAEKFKADASLIPIKARIEGNDLLSSEPDSVLGANEAKLDPDGTKQLSLIRKAYQGIYGPAPKINGQIDYPAMEVSIRDLAKRRTDGMLTPAQQLLLKSIDNNPQALSQALNPDGSVKPAAQLQGVLANAQAPLTSEQKLAAQHKLQMVAPTREAFQATLATLNSSKHDLTGPGLFEGGAPELVAIAARLGIGKEKFQEQSQLQTAVGQAMLEQIRSLGGMGLGQIRNTEIKWMEKQVPNLSWSKGRWQKWLQNSIKISEAAEQDYKAIAAGKMPEDRPVVNTTLDVDPEGNVVLKSQQDYDSIPEGTEYVDMKGVKGVKGRRAGQPQASTATTPPVR